MPKHVCVLTPRDGLFLKDGRGWYTSSLGNGRTLDWPMPSTIHAALRSSVGRAWEAAGRGVLAPGDGPTGWVTITQGVRLDRLMALRRVLSGSTEPWSTKHRVWPVPDDAFFSEDKEEGVVRLDPRPPQCAMLGRDDDHTREAMWRAVAPGEGKPGKRPVWWCEEMFIQWLVGEKLDKVARKEPFAFERLPIRPRTHLAIDANTATAEEGKLYGTETVEFLRKGKVDGQSAGKPFEEWAIGVEVELPADRSLGSTLAVGGKRRLAGLETSTDLFGEIPQSLAEAVRGSWSSSNRPRRLRLVVVAPTEFQRGWLPDGFRANGEQYEGHLPVAGGERFGTWILRAAMVGRPLPVSGWDMAKRAPKPTQRLVPPGAVYFFEQKSHEEVDPQALWMARIGAGMAGCVVPGVWPAS